MSKGVNDRIEALPFSNIKPDIEILEGQTVKFKGFGDKLDGVVFEVKRVKLNAISLVPIKPV